MDENSPEAAKTILADWGRNIPIIKIGDYVLNTGDLKEFTLQIALNSFPTFRIIVDDASYKIRESLKNDIDKCVIFLGFDNWYIRFNGIIDRTFSVDSNNSITLNGKYYNKKIYDGIQISYKDKSVSSILEDVCRKTNMGLFTTNNSDLNKVLDYSLMTGTRFIDYFDSIIKTYTKNVYFIDCHSYIHVGEIQTLRKQPLDKYSLNWASGKKIPEQPIIFKSINRTVENPEEQDYEIPISTFVVNTNFGEIFKETYDSYSLGFGGNGEKKLDSLSGIGIGSNKTNTFFGFKNHKFPYYNDIVNKSLGGNSIKITTNNIIFELSPLSVVEAKLYLPNKNRQDFVLDEEHSGKKIVIGFSIDYRKAAKTLNKLTQTIELI